MRIEKLENNIKEGQKRHWMPYKILYQCSKCKKELINNFSSDYFSYPKLNKEFETTIYKECDCGFENENKIKVIIKETLELID